MGARAEEQHAAVLPPRRGQVWAVTVDSTARAYDLSALGLAGMPAPEAAGTRPQHVMLYLQADTNDVYFYFDSATGTALDNTAAQAAGSAAVGMQNAHAAMLKVGAPFKVRIDRSLDKFLVLRVATTAGTLRLWAGSAQSD